MNIIFGESVNSVSDHYIKLELDTIRIARTGQIITAYCLVEHIPLGEFPQVESNKRVHESLLENYKKQNWDFCKRTIPFLIGAWNGEVDSFYNELLTRIEKLQNKTLPVDWDGTIEKN